MQMTMIHKGLKKRTYLPVLGLFLALTCATAQAQFVINGFGLSGGATALDTSVAPGQDVYVILLVDVPLGWHIEGVGLESRPSFLLSGIFYSEDEPEGFPESIESMEVDSTTFLVDSSQNPHVVRFQATVPDPLNNALRSMQMNAVVFGTDNVGERQYSTEVVSFIAVDEIEPILNPVDPQHKPWLAIERPSASRPVFSSPDSSSTVGRTFLVQYDQPLNARTHSLILDINEVFETGGQIAHRLFIEDTLAGDDKTVQINCLNLAQSDGIDSISGPASLNHRSRLFLRMFYRVAGGQGEQSDTATVGNVFVDLLTDLPTLTEPRVGAESPEPDIRVIYRLPEAADSVQLVFEVDSLTTVTDPFSPHIITLLPQHNSSGEHYLILDGTNIGTGGPNVLHSNNGPEDELFEQALYNVSLIYGDLYGNPISVVMNPGYIWPEDLTTVPPRLIAPNTGGVDNNSYWVQFELPEAPLVGSVYIEFTAVPPYPGSPHTIFLGEHASSGVASLVLNSQALDLSGAPVTSVEGGTALQHGSRYLLRVGYRDHYGNEDARSTGRLVSYDGATELPLIQLPRQGDSLAFAGSEVFYEQPEHATPGSLKIILEQTGGPEVDLLSPHTLFLSDADSGLIKSVTIHPAFIGVGEGIDSVTNAGSLVARGIYKMTLAYRDILLNNEASTFVRDLYFPSGSSVSIRGSVLSTEIIPGASDVPLMQFALSASGESALRGITLGVEGTLENTDITASRMILWASVDSLLQVGLDEPLDTLDFWFNGDMQWDSIGHPISQNERHIIISGAFPANANPANQVNLVLRSSEDVDCGGDPVLCVECPIGMPDIALPVQVSRMYVEQDTTFSALVVNWIVEAEYNVLGFRLWRTDNETGINTVVASYATNFELYGRGNAATSRRYRYVDRGLRGDLTYTYSIDVVSTDGLTVHAVGLTASGTPASPPSSFVLNKIYPNPFNQEVTIEFVVPFTETTELTVYNVLGQPVRELIDAQLAPSVYRAHWDGTNDAGLSVPSGLYIVRLKAAGRFDSAQRLLLVR